MSAFTFRPRLVPTLAAAAMIALTLWLGRWQTQRAAEKSQLQALYEARGRESPVRLSGSSTQPELLYRRVAASGRWLGERQFFVDNRVHAGIAGFAVVAPLAIQGSDAAVLVERGWIARTGAYPSAPQISPPQGEATVHGLAILPPLHVLELSSDTVSGNVWQNLSIERYAKASGLKLLPFVLLEDDPPPPLAALRERPNVDVDRHREYALTWFSLAATALGLWIVLNVRRRAP